VIVFHFAVAGNLLLAVSPRRFDEQILCRNIHMFLFFGLDLHGQTHCKMGKKLKQNHS